MAEYEVARAIGEVASALKSLASAEQNKAIALDNMAKTYKRQVDLQEYGTT